MSLKQEPTFRTLLETSFWERIVVNTYEGIGVMTEEQIYSVSRLFHRHDTNCSFTMTVLHAWMS
jgi:hypothetical protein